jgi:hypothetical protein
VYPAEIEADVGILIKKTDYEEKEDFEDPRTFGDFDWIHAVV